MMMMKIMIMTVSSLYLMEVRNMLRLLLELVIDSLGLLSLVTHGHLLRLRIHWGWH